MAIFALKYTSLCLLSLFHKKKSSPKKTPAPHKKYILYKHHIFLSYFICIKMESQRKQNENKLKLKVIFFDLIHWFCFIFCFWKILATIIITHAYFSVHMKFKSTIGILLCMEWQLLTVQSSFFDIVKHRISPRWTVLLQIIQYLPYLFNTIVLSTLIGMKLITW